MSKVELTKTLNGHIHNPIVSELVKEYEKAKTSFWLDDELKTLIHSARFSELSIQALECLSNPNCSYDLNKIEFGKIYEKLIKLPKKNLKTKFYFWLCPKH